MSNELSDPLAVLVALSIECLLHWYIYTNVFPRVNGVIPSRDIMWFIPIGVSKEEDARTPNVLEPPVIPLVPLGYYSTMSGRRCWVLPRKKRKK